MLTALGNDVGFELVFSRQLIAHGQPGDIAVGLSTSGDSRNLLVAFAEAASARHAHHRLAGYDGGEMARGRTSTTASSCAVRQRPPHPGDAGALGFALWREVQAPADAEAPIGWLTTPTARRRCSSASRRSGAGGRG